MILWHGSRRRIGSIDLSRTVDGGLHLGTEAQARMRNSAFLHEIEIEVTRLRRSRDTGGNWAGRIQTARKDGCHAIIYLNRYEGIPADRIEDLHRQGLLSRIDTLSDAAFRKLVPEARDSLILLDPGRARLLRIIARDALRLTDRPAKDLPLPPDHIPGHPPDLTRDQDRDPNRDQDGLMPEV